MTNRNAIFASFAGALLLTASPAALAQQDPMARGADRPAATQGAQTQAAGEFKADEIIGKSVENLQGENVGDVDAVILDKDGKANAVVLGVGGFLGIGEHNVAVSWDKLNISQRGDKITINMTEEQLKALPEYRYRDQANRRTAFFDPDYRGDVRDRTRVGGRAAGRELAEARDTGPRRADVYAPGGELRAEALIGKDVHNARGEDIGNIEDILIGKGGKLQAVVSVGGFLGIGDRDVLVDWDRFKITREPGSDDARIVANLTKQQLEVMPQYQAERR